MRRSSLYIRGATEVIYSEQTNTQRSHVEPRKGPGCLIVFLLATRARCDPGGAGAGSELGDGLPRRSLRQLLRTALAAPELACSPLEALRQRHAAAGAGSHQSARGPRQRHAAAGARDFGPQSARGLARGLRGGLHVFGLWSSVVRKICRESFLVAVFARVLDDDVFVPPKNCAGQRLDPSSPEIYFTAPPKKTVLDNV